MKINDFLKSGHLPTLFSAFPYFDISFMVWVLLGTLGGPGGFFLPNILGSLKDIIGTYSPGFIVFALVALAATFILLFVNSMLWKKEDWKETMPIAGLGSRIKKSFIPQSAVLI